jgi:hypothetical protein
MSLLTQFNQNTRYTTLLRIVNFGSGFVNSTLSLLIKHEV